MEGDSMRGGSKPRVGWHDLAGRAGFTFFEPVSSRRTQVWAGGFGGGADGPAMLGVHAIIDGAEVAVSTSVPVDRSSTESRTRLMLIDLLFQFVLNDDTDLELPVSILVVKDDRQISVAGRDVQFSGVRVQGDSRWAGEAEHDGLLITVTAPADAPEFSIEPCRNWTSMPELPPAGT